jgi:alkylation response protein AidB-like acyl-CoA dehydrogenase
MPADMAMQIEAARSLVYDCAGIADAGFESDAAFRAFSAKASMARCFASDMAMKVTTGAVQIFGGAGYMKDFPVERLHAGRQDQSDIRGYQSDSPSDRGAAFVIVSTVN